MIKRLLLICLVVSDAVVLNAAEEKFDITPKKAISYYRSDFNALISALDNQQSTADAVRRLQNDFFILKAALPTTSQVRKGAVSLLNKLADPIVFVEFRKSGNINLLWDTLSKIENFGGDDDDVFSEFVLLSKEGPAITESSLDKPLLLAIADLDTAIKETQRQVAATSTTKKPTALPAQESQQEELSQLSFLNIGSSSLLSPVQPKIQQSVLKRAQATNASLLEQQVHLIVTWPDEARIEKVAALQLLAASEYDKLKSEKISEQGTQKFIECTHIFKALYQLGAILPQIRESKNQKYYYVESIGSVSQKQLKDYTTKQPSVLIGFCNNLPSLKQTIKKIGEKADKQNRNKLLNAMQRFRTGYSMCAYLQGKVNAKEVQQNLLAYDEDIARLKKLMEETRTTSATTTSMMTPLTSTVSKSLNEEDRQKLHNLAAEYNQGVLSKAIGDTLKVLNLPGLNQTRIFPLLENMINKISDHYSNAKAYSLELVQAGKINLGSTFFENIFKRDIELSDKIMEFSNSLIVLGTQKLSTHQIKDLKQLLTTIPATVATAKEPSITTVTQPTTTATTMLTTSIPPTITTNITLTDEEQKALHMLKQESLKVFDEIKNGLSQLKGAKATVSTLSNLSKLQEQRSQQHQKILLHRIRLAKKKGIADFESAELDPFFQEITTINGKLWDKLRRLSLSLKLYDLSEAQKQQLERLERMEKAEKTGDVETLQQLLEEAARNTPSITETPTTGQTTSTVTSPVISPTTTYTTTTLIQQPTIAPTTTTATTAATPITQQPTTTTVTLPAQKQSTGFLAGIGNWFYNLFSPSSWRAWFAGQPAQTITPQPRSWGSWFMSFFR